jgi:acetoin utilization deacetylase AcuC-like enzyme
MARRVRELAQAAGIPLGVVLEGGYNRRVLAECVCASLAALAAWGEAGSATPAPQSDPDPVTARALAQLSRYWPL